MALKAIAADFDNVRTAWQHATVNQNISALGQAIDAFYLFVEYQGRYHEGKAIFQSTIEALSALEGSPDEAIRRKRQIVLSQVLIGQGLCCARLGQRNHSQELSNQAITNLRQIQPEAKSELATALLWTGGTFILWREHEQALPSLQECYLLYRDLDDHWGMGATLMLKGQALSQHDFHPSSTSASLLTEARRLLQDLGERRLMTYAVNCSGHLALWQGKYQEAREHYANAYQIRLELGDETGIASIHRSLGWWATATGQYDQAAQHLEKSLALHQELDTQFDTPDPLNSLGAISRLQKNHQQAEAYHQTALATSRKMKIDTSLGDSLDGLGCLAYDQAEYAKAEQYFQESLAIWQKRNSKGKLTSTLRHLGHVTLALNPAHPLVSTQYYQPALQQALETDLVPVALDILRGIAGWLSQSASVDRAIEILSLVYHHSASTAEMKAKANQQIDEFSTSLSNSLVEAAKERGQTLDWQQVATDTLAELTQFSDKKIKQIKMSDIAKTDILTQSTRRFIPEALIATGGMGEVYQGRDTETDQLVAIKRLKPDLVGQNPDLVQRLIREGEALRCLSHPNIVQILTMIEDETQPMIVLEYVSGGSLGDLLKKGASAPTGTCA